MKKLFFTSLLMLISPQITLAESCAGFSSSKTEEERVVQAALALEKLNGGGRPLTTEIYSYSSRENTWAVFFSYSGIKNVWQVITDKPGCLILSVYRSR